MQFINGNWVDLVILFIFFFFIFESTKVGFWVMFIDFIAFLGSLFLALTGYSYVAGFLKANFALSRSIANALGFLLAAIIAESVLSIGFAKLLSKIPKKLLQIKNQKFLATIPAIGESIVLVSFILTLALGFPILPKVKTDITNSKIGGYLVEKTSGVEARLGEVFGGIIEDSLTYFTIRPGSTESIPLEIEIRELTIDEVAESGMLNLVNEERKKEGVGELVWRGEVVPIARLHARDMWERKYFSHYSPEGESVGDRLDSNGVSYFLAGENLALAPTLRTAHTGLMNSEGHRKNILDSRFKRVGIGVIDNGRYGKMFVQIFTD